MEPKKIALFVAIGALPLLLIANMTGEFDEEPPEPKTQAERRYDRIMDAMDDGSFPLRIGFSNIAAAIDYMGRGPDNLDRSPSDMRRAHFDMSDGSTLVFYFEPRDSGGLGFDHVRAE